ncbi:c-type cytochrome [Aromatoleum toluvorans]|uniref:C-type cytochrome n=2 Tax=Aromatoleum toluvorans TaxID=92002 RepID=A0ABX1PWQ6_9RHOO|nr:c-type cytochrome [Aromatoleum toluvorans]
MRRHCHESRGRTFGIRLTRTAMAALLAAASPAWGHDGTDHGATAPAGEARQVDAGTDGRASGAVPSPRGTRWGAGYFPNVPLVTQDGRNVRFYDDLLKGKAVAINLIYTHCEDSCPLETARLAQVQQILGERAGRDIHFYSISIDPERDTPAVLKAYAEKFQAGRGWLFLTGRMDDIARIARKMGLSSLTDSADRDGHLPSLMVGTADGQWMRLSAMDNPRFLATKIETFVGGWKDRPAAPDKSYAAVKPIRDFDAGGYLFRTRCAACHTIGRGDAVGPDLQGVTERRERAWLHRFIKTPDAVLADKDPVALELFRKYKEVRMPNLRLGDGDVDALIRYIEAQTVPGRDRSAPKEG